MHVNLVNSGTTKKKNLGDVSSYDKL
uniref:Uncharacterized protein n=1 Tax=Anguilla anguilla TaxID=7936 RepID=A0A0E9UN31_ANGAN